MRTSAYERCLLLLATQEESIIIARELRADNVFHLSMDGGYDSDGQISLSDEQLAADIQLIMEDEMFACLAPIKKILVHLILARKEWPQDLMPLSRCLAPTVLQLTGEIALATRVTRDDFCQTCQVTFVEVHGSQTTFEDEERGSSGWVAPQYCMLCLALASSDNYNC